MKRFLSILLVCAIFVTIPYPIYADGTLGGKGMTENETIDEISNGIEDAKKAASSVSALAKDTKALKNVTSTFDDFMKGVSTCSTILSTVNGSVSFLRFIGVLEDPSQTSLNNISTQITIMNERLTELDGKISKITDAMSEIKASDDFNARTQTALTLEQNWNNFTTNYCENGLDKMMSTYDGMCLNGIKAWCNNKTTTARNDGDIDNTYITILYKKTSAGYRLTFSTENGVPSSFTKDDRWVRIDAKRIADTVTFDANLYHNELKSVMLNAVSGLLAVDKSGIEVYNYDDLYKQLNTKNQSKYLNALAEDAVSTLLYRIAATELNKDATFTKEVIRTYVAYTLGLARKNSGLDALTKMYYYTHNFESEVSSTLTEILNTLTVKNAVYGAFAMNIAGASSFATDVEKETIAYDFANTTKLLRETKKNAFTGINNYSYVTGGKIYTNDFELNADASVVITVYTNGTTQYKSYTNTPIKYSSNRYIEDSDKASRASDTQVLLMQYIANSNGQKFNFDYLTKYTNASFAKDRNYIVTSMESESAFTIDGSFKLNTRVISGSYFTNTTISKLPSSANEQYLVLRNKVMGNVYHLSANKIESYQPLLAMGIYAEHHTAWRYSEVAYLAGSVNMDNMSTSSNDQATGSIERTYNFTTTSHFNELLSVPVSNKVSFNDNGTTEYNPIQSYAESLTETIEVVDASVVNDVVDNENPTIPDKQTSSHLPWIAVCSIVAAGVLVYFTRKRKQS